MGQAINATTTIATIAPVDRPPPAAGDGSVSPSAGSFGTRISAAT
jgi:hypothetical protein